MCRGDASPSAWWPIARGSPVQPFMRRSTGIRAPISGSAKKSGRPFRRSSRSSGTSRTTPRACLSPGEAAISACSSTPSTFSSAGCSDAPFPNGACSTDSWRSSNTTISILRSNAASSKCSSRAGSTPSSQSPAEISTAISSRDSPQTEFRSFSASTMRFPLQTADTSESAKPILRIRSANSSRATAYAEPRT